MPSLKCNSRAPSTSAEVYDLFSIFGSIGNFSSQKSGDYVAMRHGGTEDRLLWRPGAVPAYSAISWAYQVTLGLEPFVAGCGT